MSERIATNGNGAEKSMAAAGIAQIGNAVTPERSWSGTAEALVAAGLARLDEMPSTRVTYGPDGKRASNKSFKDWRPGARRIERLGRGNRFRVTVCGDEHAREEGKAGVQASQADQRKAQEAALGELTGLIEACTARVRGEPKAAVSGNDGAPFGAEALQSELDKARAALKVAEEEAAEIMSFLAKIQALVGLSKPLEQLIETRSLFIAIDAIVDKVYATYGEE